MTCNRDLLRAVIPHVAPMSYCMIGCSMSDFETAMPRSSQDHWTWSQNIHCWCQRHARGNILDRHIKDSVMTDVTATDDTFFLHPPAAPTPLHAHNEDSQDDMCTGLIDMFHECTCSLGEGGGGGSNVEMFMNALLIRNMYIILKQHLHVMDTVLFSLAITIF